VYTLAKHEHKWVYVYIYIYIRVSIHIYLDNVWSYLNVYPSMRKRNNNHVWIMSNISMHHMWIPHVTCINKFWHRSWLLTVLVMFHKEWVTSHLWSSQVRKIPFWNLNVDLVAVLFHLSHTWISQVKYHDTCHVNHVNHTHINEGVTPWFWISHMP